MKNLLLLCLGLCCLCSGAFAAEQNKSQHAEQLNWSGDRILARVIVPSIEQPQGEVQLLQRGNLLVVQTLLSSRILKRVVAAIDAREQRNWPETVEGHLASLRYRDELFRATEESWQRFRQRNDRNETHQTLAIEFILAAETSLIALSVPTLRGDYGHLQLIDKQPVKSWRVNGDYVRKNIFKIIEDSFRLDQTATAERLKTLWPGPEPAAGH